MQSLLFTHGHALLVNLYFIIITEAKSFYRLPLKPFSRNFKVIARGLQTILRLEWDIPFEPDAGNAAVGKRITSFPTPKNRFFGVDIERHR
jgi:hypothetical protein